MKTMISIAVILAVALVALVPVSASGRFDHIISPVDVEKVTGIAGIREVPRQPLDKFRNGDLNFVTKGDQPILMVQFRPVQVADVNMFENLKSDSGYFKAAVPGIGEEAFTSPSFSPQFSVNVRKGHYIAVVTTHVDPRDKTKTVLPMEQLLTLAKLVASKM